MSQEQKILQGLQSKLQRVAGRTRTLEKSVGKIGSVEDTPNVRRTVRDLSGECKRLIGLCQKDLQGINAGDVPDVQKVAVQKMTSALEKEDKRLESLRAQLAVKEAKFPNPTLAPAPAAPTAQDGKQALPREVPRPSRGEGQAETGRVQNQVQQPAEYCTASLDIDIAIRNEFHGDVVMMAGELDELHDTFIDMDYLAKSQAPEIKEARSNIQKANEAVVTAQKDIHHAGEYQQSGRKWMCYIMGALILVGGAVCFFLSRTGSDEQTAN